MSEEKFELTRLVKLMGMTTSAHDAEALVALRAANREIEKLQKNWTEILTGCVKITVMEDPFARSTVPDNANVGTSRGSATTPDRPTPSPNFNQAAQNYRTRRPQTPPRPQGNYCVDCSTPIGHGSVRCSACLSKQAAAAQRMAAAAQQRGRKPNKFAGLCMICKERVGAGDGFLVQQNVRGSWEIECDKARNPKCAPKQKPTPGSGKRPSAADLADLI